MGIIKGQNFRVLLGTGAEGTDTPVIVAAATSCQLHISAQLESSETKDDTDSWSSQECVGKSWDGSADALVIVESNETGLTAFGATELIGKNVAIKYEQTDSSSTKNRTALASGVTYSGNAIINDVSITAANKQNGTYTVQFTGVGELTKGTTAN